MILKILLFTIFAFLIISKTYVVPPECNLRTSFQAIPPRIHFEQTIDGKDQRTIITRFLHNKPGIFLSEFWGCYFSVLDLRTVYNYASIAGVIFTIYLIYILASQKKYLLLPILIFPMVPFFHLAPNFTPIFFKGLSIMALVKFLIDTKR